MSTDASAMMTRDVCTVTPDATVAAIAEILVKHDISAVPVCDQAGALLGVVTESDLIRPFAETNELRRAWWLSLLAEGSELAPNFLASIRRNQLHARDLMTAPVITATEKTTLPQLAELMTRHRIKRVPIIRDSRVVGIVSRADLVRALSQMSGDTAVRARPGPAARLGSRKDVPGAGRDAGPHPGSPSCAFVPE